MPEKRPYLAVNQVLEPGDSLVSPNGQYVAFLQDSGQLGLCFTVEGSSSPDWNRCYWRTPASPGNQPWGVMQEDGNFVLYNDKQNGIPYFASNTNVDRAFVTTVLDDGNLVVCTGTPEDPEEIVWSALPQISAECKFMQNYRVTVPVNGGPDVLAIRNKAGAIELFTLGSTGDIYTFWPDSASETGYSQAALTSGLKASHLAGGADQDGNVVLFASSGSVVYSLSEASGTKPRWGTPQPIVTPSYPVNALAARNIGGTLYLAALQRVSNLDQVSYLAWGSPGGKLSLITPALTAAGPLFWHALPSAPGVAPEPTLSLVIEGGKLYSWSIPSLRNTSAAINANQAVLGLDVATDGTGTDWVVAALHNGQVARLAPGSDPSQPYTWMPLWPDISYTDYSAQFQDVVAETDAAGGVHVFAVSKPQPAVDGDPASYNVLYHQAPGLPAGSQPVPIYKSTGLQLAGVANDGGSIDLFTVTASNLVTHLFLAGNESNWTEERVLDPADDTAPITEYSSYATDITLYDSDQAGLANEPVSVYASSRSRVEINGLTFFVDEHVPAPVVTSSSGTLYLTQETGSLASPFLHLQLSASRMPPTAPQIIVEPYADVHKELADQTADTLLATKVTGDDGSDYELLQGEYRQGTTPASLAAALDSFLGGQYGRGELGSGPLSVAHGGAAHGGAALAAARTARGRSSTGRQRDRFWSRQELHPHGLRHAAALSGGRPIVLTFHENGLSHEHVTAEHAVRLSEEKLAALPDVNTAGIRDWFSSIGDAFRAVANGIAKVAQVIYDGLAATFEFIVDGIAYAFQAVVQFLEDAFDFIEMVFSYVKVFFETLYRWLAWLFDWKSIKQAKICIYTGFEQMLEFLQGAVAQLRIIVDNGIENYKQQFADQMDEVIRLLTGYSIGGYAQHNAQYDADASTATSNNFFFSQFLANGANVPMPAMSFAASDPVTTLASLLTQLNTTEQASTGTWNAALAFFSNLGTSPDEIFRNLLSCLLTVLKNLGLVALDLAKAIVDALLDAVSDVLGAFHQMMIQKISIPFVSAFYKWITGGDELTALNVVSLAAAIPSAIVYKLITGEAMFTETSGPGSSDDVTSWLKSSLMLQAAGLAPQPSMAPFPPTTKRTARILAGFYLASNFMSWAGAASMDIEPPTVSVPLALNCVALGWSVASAVFSFPYFYADAGSTNIEFQIYLGQCYLLAGMAFGYTYYYKLPGPAASDIMAVAFTVAGAFLIKDAVYTTQEHPDARVAAWSIIQRCPWALKFLRTTPVVAATDSGSLYALAWFDMALGGITTSVLGFLILRDRYDADSAQQVTARHRAIAAGPA